MGMTSFGGSAAREGPQPAPSVAALLPLTVVVLTDSPAETARVVNSLTGAGYSVRLAAAIDGSVDVVVADFDAGGFDVLQVLAAARSKVPAVPFVVLSGPLEADVAVDYIKRGVSDWVLKDRLERLPRAVDRRSASAPSPASRRGPSPPCGRARGGWPGRSTSPMSGHGSGTPWPAR